MRESLLAVVAILLALGLAVICCWRRRSSPSPPPPSPPSSLIRQQSVLRNPNRPVNLPSIHPSLWLGNVVSAANAGGEFDHVVCVAYGETCGAAPIRSVYADDTFPDAPDVSRDDFEARVKRAAANIHEALERGDAVLVHCHAGINRSVSAIVAYAALYRGVGASVSIPYIRAANKSRRDLPALTNRTFERYCSTMFGGG